MTVERDNPPPKLKSWANQALLIYFLPFWYGAITRLPFLYFVIHMRNHFELDWLSIGFYVGAYQAARVVTGMAALVTSPYISHCVGTAIGLAGNILVLVSDNADLVPFLVGTIIIGFSETLACMQTYAKAFYQNDIDVLEHSLKVQYAAVCCGVTFAFGMGGVIYQYAGIDGIAVFGTIASSAEMISFLCYFALNSKEIIPWNEVTDDSVGSSSHAVQTSESSNTNQLPENQKTSGELAKDIDKKRTSLLNEDHVRAVMDAFSHSGSGANFLSYIIAITIGMEAITIGYNLAISPIFIMDFYGRQEGVIGIMLASGAAGGTLVCILVTLTSKGKAIMDKVLPSPYNMLASMAGISISVLLTAVPSFPVHILGLICLMASNDLAAILLNELQGMITSTESYKTIAPLGQIIRRSLNVFTAVTGPLLYSVFPTLPYFVASAITAMWTLIVAIIIRDRMKKNKKDLDRFKLDAEASSLPKSNFGRQEITARSLNRLEAGKARQSLFVRLQLSVRRLSSTLAGEKPRPQLDITDTV